MGTWPSAYAAGAWARDAETSSLRKCAPNADLMAEDDQGVEKLKPCRYDNEHVDGGKVMPVILQKRAPGRGGAPGPPRQVSADRGLADLDPELEQLAVDAGSAPKWVSLAHLADQITDLAAHPGPSQTA